ncbi:paired-like homeodomain transcription factor LEUTX [Cavia porcellus]|uniref:paired-like homeodomain transcription factor LEUTX n=1 Tax=Cavia porcellus TaxID=10141 RepID=UPI002FE17F5C
MRKHCLAAAMSRKPDKIEYRRKPRTDFTPSQRSVLLSAFEKNNHAGPDVTKELATKINVDETVIKIWFKNQRSKRKKDQLKMKLASLPGTSTQTSSEKKEQVQQSPVASCSSISSISDDHVCDRPEHFEKDISRRHGASVFGSSFQSQPDGTQGQYVEDFDIDDTDKLVEMYYLPEEDDPSSLDIYLPPGCLS